MNKSVRNFIILNKHKRLKRLWQFFFTGWGLVMIVALIAGALFSKQLLWSPISAINMTDIASNQFKMTNATFSGTDNNGEPFHIAAKTGRQEYDNPDVIYLEKISGNTTRIQKQQKIIYKFVANNGEFNRKKRFIKLSGNVNIKTSDGTNLETKELVIKL